MIHLARFVFGIKKDVKAAFRRGFFIAWRGGIRPQRHLALADVVGTRSEESGRQDQKKPHARASLVLPSCIPYCPCGGSARQGYEEEERWCCEEEVEPEV